MPWIDTQRAATASECSHRKERDSQIDPPPHAPACNRSLDRYRRRTVILRLALSLSFLCFWLIIPTFGQTGVPFSGAGNYGGTSRYVFSSGGSSFLEGPIRITVSSKGSFTANLGWFLRLRGTFAPDGTFHRSVTGLDDEPHDVDLRLDAATATITGTATNRFSSFYDFQAERKTYSTQNPSPQAGRYSFTTVNTSILPYRDRDTYYFGTGYGTMKVSTNGYVRCSGRQGDGAPWSAGTWIYGANQCSFATHPPYPGYDSGDLVVAFRFEDLPDRDATGEFSWSRLIHRPYAYISLDPPGYVVDSTFIASRFAPGTPFLKLSGETSNARLAYAGGGLAAPAEQTLSWPATNLVTPTAPGDPAFHLTLNATSGLFRGSFRTSSGALKPFAGAVLQKANVAEGFFGQGGRRGPMSITPIAPSVP